MPSETERTPASLRFGPDLEFDLHACRLSRAGRALKLERIPFDILALLTERPGQLVTRQDIIDRVWGAGAFLDTHNSINVAVRKIRRVLKDDAEHPRFVETITGRGYRFIAPVAERRDVAAREEQASGRGGPPAASEPVLLPSAWRFGKMRGRLVAAALAGAVAIGTAAVGSRLLRYESVAAGVHSGRLMLAVMPFDNLTGDPSQDYFSDGLTEEMITRLGSLDPAHLGVIGRASVMRYKGGRAGSGEAGRALGVQYMLEGSVRRGEGRIRVSTQLVRASDETQLWTRQFDRELGDLLALQDEIARAVAQEIPLAVEESPPGGAVAPESLTAAGYEAYDLYLKGRYHWNKRTTEGFQQAVRYFEQAASKDPSFARTYAGLADSYALMMSYGVAGRTELLPRARVAAQRALSLDPALAEAHASRGLIALVSEWDWQRAEAEYRRAIQLDPNYATAHQWYAESLAFQGRFEEAFAESGRARQLDPLSLIRAADHGAWLYFARRYDEAIEQFRAVLAAEPRFPRARTIVLAMTEMGRFDAALQHIHDWRREENTGLTWIFEAYVQGRMGRTAEARRTVEIFEGLQPALRPDPLPKLALAYAGMGDVEMAIHTLQAAFAERSHIMITLKVEPAYDGLRGDPRFEDLLRQVGFDAGKRD